jgi:hypothetical protein
VIKAIIFSFALGVIFSQDVKQFAQEKTDMAISDLRTMLQMDALDKISDALSR